MARERGRCAKKKKPGETTRQAAPHQPVREEVGRGGGRKAGGRRFMGKQEKRGRRSTPRSSSRSQISTPAAATASGMRLPPPLPPTTSSTLCCGLRQPSGKTAVTGTQTSTACSAVCGNVQTFFRQQRMLKNKQTNKKRICGVARKVEMKSECKDQAVEQITVT